MGFLMSDIMGIQGAIVNGLEMTWVATKAGLHPRFGLCVFSWCPPRDPKNCHALNVICVQQQPHTHFSVTPTTMHMGTNRKAQQSCGSGTNRE